MELGVLRAVWGLFSRMFPWAVRWYYTDDRLRTMVAVDVRSNNGVVLTRHSALPELSLWLQVTNHSPFEITLDRIAADVWFGQPTCYLTNILPVKVKPQSTVSDICCKALLSPNQVEMAEKVTGLDSGGWFHLYLALVCKNSVRDFTLRPPAIERQGKAVAGMIT